MAYFQEPEGRTKEVFKDTKGSGTSGSDGQFSKVEGIIHSEGIFILP